jgi:hypothetical protein
LKTIAKIGLLFLLVATLSCVNYKFYEAYAEKVDSLQATLEASATSFEQIDTTTIAFQNSQIKQNLDSLSSLGEEIVSATVNDYYYIEKSYKTFLREYPLAMEELQFCRQQLTNLKHDIEHRYLDEELIKSYFSHEEEAVGLLKQKMEILGKTANRQMETFDRVNPRIDLMIDSLSKIN